MISPLPLPDWVPWWVHLVLLLSALLFALLFLLMPFSVFGVKARLEGVEARLDEIQGEIRSLAMRLPEPYEPGLDYVRPDERGGQRPPIPPAPRRAEASRMETGRAETGRAEMGRAEMGRAEARGSRPGRTEPRLY